MLPYTTVEEAEAALNRTLTVSETLWLKYSANKSDYLLYCHNLPLFFLTLSLAPLPLVAIELIPYFRRYKIQPHAKTLLPQMTACYMNVIKTSIFCVGPLQLLSYPAVKFIGIRTGLPMPSVWEVLVQLAIYFIIEDYTQYWMHRWFHCKWMYENIHCVHHEYTAPMGLASAYAHWADILILGVPSFLGPAIVPGHMVTFWLWFILRNVAGIETHCGYDFPWNPTKYIPFYGGAKYHDYHHFVGGQSQSNFATLFTYCDYIYGTDKGYRYQKKLLAKLKEDPARVAKKSEY